MRHCVSTCWSPICLFGFQEAERRQQVCAVFQASLAGGCLVSSKASGVRSMRNSWSDRGSAAVDVGDLGLAKQCFSRAMKEESANSSHRFHLAIVLERLGEIDAAAQQLTHSLRLDPKRV